ncbi:type II toxin-antitoxin system HicB family antitoxin [Nostoc sp. MS1]|uniref:type II toxin-antitoxin system HicB family antitoxin n=1 Tax=Nostoc sp. MS1 TaxID=2764711 RepID=UPI001CC3F31D|nr:type II toxin-antitoxin system HicB family antitoxin [Nostoc sp. MS1]BCL34987.1 antitoxin HicB [Nostoc sp. MS1]
MRYKGYEAVVEFDDEAEIFHGEVINIRDVITFQADNVKELKQAFHDSVDDYLEFCKERGEEPEKPFSGKLMLRINPELHKTIAVKAKKEGKSLNSWIEKCLCQYAG